MAISAFSKSRSVTLAQATDGTVSVSAQTEGVVAGLTAELTGLFNGGSTTSVGLSSTAAKLATVYGGMAAQRMLLNVPGLPFTNGLRG